GRAAAARAAGGPVERVGRGVVPRLALRRPVPGGRAAGLPARCGDAVRRGARAALKAGRVACAARAAVPEALRAAKAAAGLRSALRGASAAPAPAAALSAAAAAQAAAEQASASATAPAAQQVAEVDGAAASGRRQGRGGRAGGHVAAGARTVAPAAAAALFADRDRLLAEVAGDAPAACRTGRARRSTAAATLRDARLAGTHRDERDPGLQDLRVARVEHDVPGVGALDRAVVADLGPRAAVAVRDLPFQGELDQDPARQRVLDAAVPLVQLLGFVSEGR